MNASPTSDSSKQAWVSSTIDPRFPNDDLPFRELAKNYNFQNTSRRVEVFTRLALKECRACASPVKVLDIGCGTGIGRERTFQWALRECIDEYWGIEPDRNPDLDDGLFDHVEYAMLEEASLPANHFDVVYSYMVMEHVPHPQNFLNAVFRTLKPGGVYLFATPNGKHYFTRIAKLLKQIGLDDFILKKIRGDLVEDYHYPVHYSCNTERKIQHVSQLSGFATPEIVYIESEDVKPYLPGPLRPLYHMMTFKRQFICNPKCLVTLIGRLEKPAT